MCGVLEASGVIGALVFCCGSASGPSHPSVEVVSSTDWDLFFSLQVPSSLSENNCQIKPALSSRYGLLCLVVPLRASQNTELAYI